MLEIRGEAADLCMRQVLDVEPPELTLSKLRTAYEVNTKCESGAYFKKSSGPSSSLTSMAQVLAEE